MALPENLIEYLNVKKVEMATKIFISEKGMSAYVVIIPISEIIEQQYKSNLLPIVSYEVRLMKHKSIYTYEKWGFDYDYVLEDITTRIKRIFIKRTDDNVELENLLNSLPITVHEFHRIRNFDSALVNSPMNCYLENPKEFPHLWQDFL